MPTFNYVLALFPWTRGFARDLYGIAVNPLRTIGLGLVGIIPNIVFLLILALVTRYGLKIIRLIFDGLARRTLTLRGFDPDWAWPTYRLVRFLVIVFAVIVAYPYIPGSESAAFKGVSLFMGIVFSLGSSSLMGNFIAGYGMTYRKAFKFGDRVQDRGTSWRCRTCAAARDASSHTQERGSDCAQLHDFEWRRLSTTAPWLVKAGSSCTQR